jgi:ribonuclease BN (tRNA processing enzyme)
MKLVLLGSGGYFPTSRRHTACLLLPEIGVVLDAGSGICRLGEYRQTERLDVFLSHAHLDHILGLTYLINVVPAEVARNTIVRGEAAKLDAVRKHLFAELVFPVAPPFRFEPLGGPCALPRGGTLTHFPLAHPGGSVGFRLDWPGHSMAYVTDTTAAADAPYVAALNGVKLLVHEAYFATAANDRPAVTGHSWLEAVAEVAAAAHVGRLVVVHLDPQLPGDSAFDLPAARRIFQAITIGTDGMELDF